MNIVSFIPAERLDDLTAATGFGKFDNVDCEYKFTWLLERIGLLKEQAEKVAIVHDNPEIRQLVAVIQDYRRMEAAMQNTIAAYQVEMENLRKKLRRCEERHKG